MGISGTRSCCLRKGLSPCKMHGASQDSSAVPSGPSSCSVEAGTSGFLSSADMDLGDSLEFPQWNQALSRVETCKSALRSSWKTRVRLPVRLTLGLVAFCRGATGLSHLPSCFELKLGVAVESVQGSQVYLESLGHWGHLKWWHDSWSPRVSS